MRNSFLWCCKRTRQKLPHCAPPDVFYPLISRGVRAVAFRLQVEPRAEVQPGGGMAMLMTIFVVLLVLWLLGMVTSYTLYGFIHLLLVLAVVVLLIRLIQGRNPL
jgi:Family of unknown function (DUF5670)